MGASYKFISWNIYKKRFDAILFSLIAIYCVTFISLTLLLNSEVTQETLLIRTFGTLAVLLLHIILLIGPLSRLDSRFLPLLYNRRHLGVTMFLIAAVHGIFSIIQFHSLGNVNPIVSLFSANKHYESFTKFPFEALGFIALVILFLMAITSHDFWLHHIGPRTWKILHMMVYIAYVLIIGHILLGALQFETSPILFSLLSIGAISVASVHLIASKKEFIKDKPLTSADKDGFIKIGLVNDIHEKKAKVFCIGTERIAVFKYEQKLAAISNVCQHQNGPLGEGEIIDGCVTCPWHGYQYFPQNGISPPPFKEQVANYQLRVVENQIWIHPTPHRDGANREVIIKNK